MSAAAAKLKAPSQPGAEPEYRSRVMGLLTVCIGTGLIGIANAGLMAEWLGPPTAVFVMASEGLVMIAWALARWPMLRQSGI